MALTLDFMRQLVRSRLDDEDYEDEYLDQALNEAQWDILRNRQFSFMEASTTVTLLTATNSIPYPTDVRNLIGVSAIATGIQRYNITEYFMDYATFQQLNSNPQISQPNAPFQWTTFAGNMLFPNLADKDYTLTVDYIKTVPRVDGTIVTTFTIPDEYQELLKIGAYMRIAKREDDYDVKQQEQIDYTRMLTDMLKSYARNPAPRGRHVMRVAGRV